ASATVTIELLPPDANNQPPIGSADAAQTGPGVPVVVEVLLNDVDPERDALRIAQFSAEATLGEVTEVDGPSGLRALRYEPAPGFEGRATFSYRPVDALDAVGEPVDVVVEVARDGDENRPPIVRPDSVRTRRSSEAEVAVLVNDDDPDGDPLTVDVVRPLPDGLDVTVRGDRLAVIARPGSGDVIPFEYEVDDGMGHVVRGAVLVVVIDEVEPNRPPVVSPDTATAVVGQTVLIDVTANDTDPDGDPLAVIDVSDAEGRGVTGLAGRSQVEFTATAFDDDSDGDGATARFTYTVSDGNGHEVDGEVTVTVLPEPLPDPPIAQDDPVTTTVDTPVTVDVLRNDGDPSGERPVLVGTPGCPGGGRATVTSDQQVRYDPPLGRDGAFRCTYEVRNSQGLTASASILITVRQPENLNEPPRAVLDQATLSPGESVTVDVAANDIDPDGDDEALRVTSSTQPLFGDATRTGNRITYVAEAELGLVTIEYVVEDEEGGIAIGRLQIRVVEPDPVEPIARPDARVIPGPGTNQSFDVLANDIDPDGENGELSVVAAARVTGEGQVELIGSLVSLTPTPDFVGDLVAEYTIEDADGLTASATVTLTVLEPLNRPPDAADDSASVVNGGTVTVSVLLNDSDPDGDPLSLSIVSGPDSSLGQAAVAGQSIRFTANPGAAGTAVIGYEVSDGSENAAATLRIEVASCAQSSPVANDRFLQTGYRQPIAIDFGSFTANGNVTDVTGPVGFDGSVYVPPEGENGNVAITYAVVNDCRQRATGTVTIDVNQDPSAQDRSISLGRGDEVGIPVSDLGSDAEPLSIASAAGQPAWVTVASSGLTFRPDESVPDGETTFTVRLVDPGGLSATSTITVTVTNLAPNSRADTVDVTSGPATVDLLANDDDPDGPESALRIQSVPATLQFTNGESGTISLQPDGRSVRITPAEGRGTASFTYTIADADGAVSTPSTVTVTGRALNRPPTVQDSAITLPEDQLQPVLVDADDPDGDDLEIVDIIDPAGVIVGDPDDLVLNVRAADPGTYAVTFAVRDADGATSNRATLTIVVTPDPGGGTDGGSTDGGSTDGGSTDGGSTDGGSTDGGATDGGATDGGSTDGGSTDGGSTDGGSTDGGSTDGGSTDGGSTDGGSTDGGSTDDGSTDGGSTDGGSTDGGSTDGGSTDGGSTDGGATDGGSTDGGATDGGATDGGSTDGGTTDGGSTDGGTTDGGTTDGGATDGAGTDGAAGAPPGSDDGGGGDDAGTTGGDPPAGP
ncbi:MAG: Ig-like domain-containing protein, partial [Actinomycetota bacterium]